MITHGYPSFGWQGLVATWGTVPPVLLADLSLFFSFSSSHPPPLLHLCQQFFLPSCNYSCYFIQPWSSRLTAMLHTLRWCHRLPGDDHLGPSIRQIKEGHSRDEGTLSSVWSILARQNAQCAASLASTQMSHHLSTHAMCLKELHRIYFAYSKGIQSALLNSFKMTILYKYVRRPYVKEHIYLTETLCLIFNLLVFNLLLK